MPRPYTKKSEYWSKPRTVAPFPVVAATPQVQQPPVIVNTAPAAAPEVKGVPFPDIMYGETQVRRPGYQAQAGAVPAQSTDFRGPASTLTLTDFQKFEHINAIPLPWAGYGDSRQYSGVKNAIELCAKAYVGISTARNAVEVAVEFSDQELYLKTSNDTVRTFFKEWFNAIQLPKLKEEFFREYYRSGNVFLYKFSGKFGPAYYKNLTQSFGRTGALKKGVAAAPGNNRIPIRYYLLNPANVFVPTGLSFPYTYVRLLSTYEIERLRTPQTDQDKQVYNDMPQFVKDQINVTSAYPLGIYLPMDPERLRFAFYKKQTYEPLAIPMLYPVLPDFEWKLRLKRMDMILAQTVEHAILLVRTGETATQYNGGNGINPNNIARLQNLLNNPALSRVLVADFTTKAEWLIPDIEKILGPEKYEVVNQDIQEGLQSIWGGGDKGGEKFANAQTKAKIFIQRLEEGQNAFLNDFLIPEVIQVCEDMGFRSIPEVGFRKIDLQDDTIMARIYAQLGQLGILTAAQVVNAIETGIMPDEDEMDEAQTKYTKDRETGKYLPLVGASVQDDAAAGGAAPSKPAGGMPGRPPGSKAPQTSKKVSPIGTSRAASMAVSMRRYSLNLKAAQDLLDHVGVGLCKRFKVKTLNEAQNVVAAALAKTIMATQPVGKWNDSVTATIAKPPVVPTEVAAELDAIGETYDVDSWDAHLLRLSKAVEVPAE